MMHFIRIALLGLLMIASGPLPGAHGEEPPASTDPETTAALKIMAKRVGVWEDEVTIKPGKLVPPGAVIKTVTTVRWAHGGRFIQAQGEGTRLQEGVEQKTSSIWILTWNRQRRQFNSWFFYSVSGPNNVDYWGGPQVAGVSEWNERTQTMSLEIEDPDSGVTASGSWRYIDSDHIEWGVVTKDKEGNVIMEQTGKCTRRKEK